MKPSARALFWYLTARGWADLEVLHAAEDSGIPSSTIYEVVRTHPDTFRLRGSAVGPAAEELRLHPAQQLE